MKNSILTFLFILTILSISIGQSDLGYTLSYGIDFINTDSDEQKQRMMSQMEGFKKTYYKSTEFEMHELIIPNLTEVRVVKEKDEIWVYLANEDKKYKFLSTKDWKEEMQNNFNRNPAVWEKSAIKNIEGLKCQNYFMISNGKKLEFCLSTDEDSQIPLSTFVEFSPHHGIPYVMESVPPQRQGSKSDAKFRISLVEKTEGIDPSKKVFNQELYEEKTYKDAEKDMMFAYMYSLLF